MSKVWFITGCSTGFGRVMAEMLLAEGSQVAATARRTDTLDDLAGRYPDLLYVAPCDVDSDTSVQSAVRAATDRFGRIDVVVNNAGYGYGGAIEEFSDDEILAQYQTNVFGVFRVLRHTVPILREQKSGHVINISSNAGFRSRAGFGLYASSKFALEAIGEALYHELLPLGIHVSNIEPGPFRTDFAGRSFRHASERISDYEATAHANLAWIDSVSGKQTGDPVKGVRAIIDLTNMENPPLRLPLGLEAVNGIREKQAHVAADMARMEAISLATDCDDVVR